MEALTPLSNQDPKMDKNYFLAIALSMLILIGYPFILRKMGIWQSKAPAPFHENAAVQNPAAERTLETAKKTVLENTVLKNSEIPVLVNERNGVYDLVFSSLGGTITKLHYLGEPDKPEKTNNLFYEGDPAHAGLFSLKLPNNDIDLSASIFKLQNQSRGNYEFVFEKAGQ